jgi:hypothetical protein
MTSRRNFLGILGASAAVPMLPPPFPTNDDLRPISAEWDMSWVERVAKPHKVVFDAPSVDNGGGLWRSVLLRDEYKEVYGTPADQIASVLVIRHSATGLVMDHSFWEDGRAGEQSQTKGRDGEWATRNPVGPPDDDDARPGAAKYTIPGFIADGGIVLACGLSFNNMVVGHYRAEGVSREDARAEALTHLMPGVILQPSGFFAVIRAQQAGCVLFSNG